MRAQSEANPLQKMRGTVQGMAISLQHISDLSHLTDTEASFPLAAEAEWGHTCWKTPTSSRGGTAERSPDALPHH